MKTRTGMTLLSGLLLASPTFAETFNQQENLVYALEVSSGLFVHETELTAQNSMGFSRKVLIAVRVVKNGNRSPEIHLQCKPSIVPDSVTVEILDPKTKKVLAVALRLFGSIEEGTNNLFKRSATDGCVENNMILGMTDNMISLTQESGIPTTLDVAGQGTLIMPKKMILKKHQ